MKFLVDSLPYYGDECPLTDICPTSEFGCPRYWSKYKVSSADNPHECYWLKEIECDGE